MNDTIAAISTPLGEGAIAVLRMSGPRALLIADAFFRGKVSLKDATPRLQYFGGVYDGDRKLDEVLMTVFRGPHSYTGEDVIEIAGHGGVLIARRLLELVLKSGARSAEPGEFTKRAYFAGKMDLTQAEAVMDLITAQTDIALRSATEQLEGRLGQSIRELREKFLELLAHVEAWIDFPDEDIDPDSVDVLRTKLSYATTEIDRLLHTARHGRVLREGYRTVIYGSPNVGKSSLLNLLLGQERAIVSSRPGTTRDVIEEVIHLGGYPLRLIDTAGVRESDDDIEVEGINRTLKQVDRADLVLHLLDGSAERVPVNAGHLLVLNKSDLGIHPTWDGVDAVRISCLNNQGLEDLEVAILKKITSGQVRERDCAVAINARHQSCLVEALEFGAAAERLLLANQPPELVAEELRGALSWIGQVVGEVDNEEVLGKIFGTFCIGK